MAIGNPFGLDHTVTVGILSAKGTQRASPDNGSPAPTTTSCRPTPAINPGNSGGPLIDMQAAA